MNNDNTNRPKVTLTPKELEAMDLEVNREIQRLGPPPSLEDLRRAGYTENSRLNRALDIISDTGRVLTLLVAEIIQSGAALIIVLVAGILEYWRVYNGAQALGQADWQCGLIALFTVTANVVIPIYSLRQLRGRTALEIEKHTVRGHLTRFRDRILGKPQKQQVDLYYNPTLNFAATILTYGTIILAAYDLLHPLLIALSTGHVDKPPVILVMELLMGLCLSLAGVFFLQSAAHAIGTRMLTDNPNRLVDHLEVQRREYEQRIEAIREDTRRRYELAKADRLEQRLNAIEDGMSPKRLSAVSKTTKDNAPKRNRNAKQTFADWFNGQPLEIQESILAGQISLRDAGERAGGVNKDTVKAYLNEFKAKQTERKPSTNGNGRGI